MFSLPVSSEWKPVPTEIKLAILPLILIKPLVGADILDISLTNLGIKEIKPYFLKQYPWEKDYFVDYVKNNLQEARIFANLSKYEYLKILIKVSLVISNQNKP